jgi:hypothetical protein
MSLRETLNRANPALTTGDPNSLSKIINPSAGHSMSLPYSSYHPHPLSPMPDSLKKSSSYSSQDSSQITFKPLSPRGRKLTEYIGTDNEGRKFRNSSPPVINASGKSHSQSPHRQPRELNSVPGHAGSGMTTLQEIEEALAPFVPPMYFYSLNPPAVSTQVASFIAGALPGESMIHKIIRTRGGTNTQQVSTSGSPSAAGIPVIPKQEYFHPTASSRTQQGLPPRFFSANSRTHAPLIPCNHNCTLVGFFETWRLKFQVVYHCGHQRYYLY